MELIHRRDISHFDGSPYLRRWSLFKQDPKVNRTRVYLHEFLSPDDPTFHDHPFNWSFSIILWGGYSERRLDPATGRKTRRVMLPGMINFIRSTDFHYVENLFGGRVFTLFVCSKRHDRSWGFWCPNRNMRVKWKQYLEEKDNE